MWTRGEAAVELRLEGRRAGRAEKELEILQMYETKCPARSNPSRLEANAVVTCRANCQRLTSRPRLKYEIKFMRHLFLAMSTKVA